MSAYRDELDDDAQRKISVAWGSIEKRGAWTVPRHLDVQVKMGSVELDLREAALVPGLTVIDISCYMGSVELIVDEDQPVEVDVASTLASVEHLTSAPRTGDPEQSVVRLVGMVKLGSVEVLARRPGESASDFECRVADQRRQHRRERRKKRWADIRAEKEMWRRNEPQNWLPWWLMARSRRRIFTWLAIACIGGFLIGHRLDNPKWWWAIPAAIVLSGMSGMIAWRLTRPLIATVRAAREIGDGKLDTRIPSHRGGGEMEMLASAINDMAEKIQKQLSDQRQLLAAVSHELRTPLGHMRVLIETARDRNDTTSLTELEKEVLVLDDLVGRLLASSRLEFGTLDRRPLDLGELVTDVATSAGIAPEAIEAIGDVRAPVDPTLVRRAIANLLDNARVHGNGAVAVRIERRANQIAIEVDDAGPGVAPDRRADAFRAFVPSSGGGLGLGLALVSRIAVAHGGGAWISERPGGGARVGFGVDATV